MSKKWVKASLVRAIKTVSQTPITIPAGESKAITYELGF